MAGNRVNLLITARDLTAAAFRSVRNNTRRLGRDMTRHLRDAGRTAGDAFGQGLRGGIGNAFAVAMKNPFIAATVIGVGATLGSLLGAALAGALTLAFGGMFVGMGIAFALQNKKIKAQWSRTLKDIGQEYKTLSKPMEEVLTTARLRLKGLADDFAPHFKKAMADTAPFVSTFIDHIANAIKGFGKKAFAPMMVAFNELLTALGPEFEEFMGELGDSFRFLAASVIRNKEAIAQAFHAIGAILTGVVYIVAFLAEQWGNGMRLMETSIRGVQNAFQSFSEGMAAAGASILAFFRTVVSGLLTGVAAVLRGMAAFNDAVGMGDMGDKLRSAARGVEGFRDSANRAFTSAKGAVDRFNQRVKDAGKVRRLKMDIAGWKAKLREAEMRLKHVPKSKQSKLKGEISDLKRKIAAAKASIASVRGKTVTIRANYVSNYSGFKGTPTFGRGGKFNPRAHGGIVGRAATGGARSNMTLVGEHGPELVNLPGGSHVRSNPDTKRMMGGGGGGGAAIVEIKSSGARIDDLLLEILRNAVRSRGGNVQLVVGGRKVA